MILEKRCNLGLEELSPDFDDESAYLSVDDVFILCNPAYEKTESARPLLSRKGRKSRGTRRRRRCHFVHR